MYANNSYFIYKRSITHANQFPIKQSHNHISRVIQLYSRDRHQLICLKIKIENCSTNQFILSTCRFIHGSRVASTICTTTLVSHRSQVPSSPSPKKDQSPQHHLCYLDSYWQPSWTHLAWQVMWPTSLMLCWI